MYTYDVDDDIDDHHAMFGIILFVFLTAILERAMDRRKKNAKTVRPGLDHRSHWRLNRPQDGEIVLVLFFCYIRI